MLNYPNINPTIFKFGPLQIRWYGVMYILGFISSYLLVKYQIRKKGLKTDMDIINDLYLFMIVGLIIGARLGYIVFYNLQFYLAHPLKLFATWEGGMSFHGGLVGIIIACLIFVKKRNISFWETADLVIVTAPIGLAFGRLGNFINAELYGRATSMPWGMVFPLGGNIPRHPSQLYELFFEGILLFAILWWLKNFSLKKGTLFCVFLFFYSLFRFFAEFFREPDPQLGFVFSSITMGQILSVCMGLAGIVLFYFISRHGAKADQA
jgi:phosphatidylglycerol:prolipoprotein diacylglycerol transferase